MINEVIIGNGESRKIKFGTFATTPTDVNDLITQLQSGTIGVDVVYPSATESAGISQAGTKLNKETLLNDDAVSSVWTSAPPTPTPSLAFKKLGGDMRAAQSNIAAASVSIASIGSQLGAKFDKTGGTINGDIILTHPSNNTKSVVLHCDDSGVLAINNVASPSGYGTGKIDVDHLNATTASFHGYINHTTGTADFANIRCSSLKIMSNFLDMNNKPLQNVATPSNDTDAANKGYVDEKLGVQFIEVSRTGTELSCNKTYAEVLSILNTESRIVFKYATGAIRATGGVYYTSSDVPSRIIFYYYSFPSPNYTPTMVRISYAPDNSLTVLT